MTRFSRVQSPDLYFAQVKKKVHLRRSTATHTYSIEDNQSSPSDSALGLTFISTSDLVFITGIPRIRSTIMQSKHWD